MRGGVRTTMVLLAAALWLLRLPYSDVHAERKSGAQKGKSGPALAIVVNRANPIDSLSFAELRKIFLGERGHWPNGRRIAVAMLDYGQPERESVLRHVYRMNEEGYRDHFIKGIFRGDVFVEPKTLSSSVVMRKFVFNAPGAIGYLRSDEVDDSVKVIRIDEHLPADPEYRLQIDESGGAK